MLLPGRGVLVAVSVVRAVSMYICDT
jgi:hypothetical protein